MYQLPLELPELKNIVKKGEGLQLEFKLKSNHPEKILKEIVAFANTKGGKLIIGVADDKEIKGLKYIEEDEFMISRSIEKHIYPIIDYNIAKIKIEGDVQVLIYDIKQSPLKPHYVDLTGLPEDRKAYVRVEDKSIQASKEVRDILKGQSKQKGYTFHYGDKEKALMQYLDNNAYITIIKFAELAELKRKEASRTLVLLVLAGVLKIVPHELEDYYERV